MLRIWEHKATISKMINPEGSNFKELNWVKLIKPIGNKFEIEIGYYITYLGCKPKYQKEIILIDREQLC